MGSVCCVASRPPRQPLSATSSSSSSSYNTNATRAPEAVNLPLPDPSSSHHWRIHGGFSPPVSSNPWTLSSVPLPYHHHHHHNQQQQQQQQRQQHPIQNHMQHHHHHPKCCDEAPPFNGGTSSGYFSSSFRRKARSQSRSQSWSRSNGNSAVGSPSSSMRRDGCNEQSTGRDGRSDDGGGSMARDIDARDRSMGRDAIHVRDAIINSRDWSMTQDRSMGQDVTNARDRTLDEQFFLRRLSCSMLQSELSLASSQSAPGSFRASSHWIRNDAGDHFASAATTPDSLSSSTVRGKEGHVTRAESSSSFRSRVELGPQASSSASSSFNANLSGGFSSLYRFGSKALFHKPRSRNHNRSKAQREKSESLVQQETKDWSMQAFSQLIASSQREGFGASGMNTIFHIVSPPEEEFEAAEGADEELSLPLSIERIQLAFSQGLNDQQQHPWSDGSARRRADARTSGASSIGTCGICSRLLTRRSPWSSQRISHSVDLPVAGVLVCGHVFHADCLEKAAPPPCALKHDPPCPECAKLKKPLPAKPNNTLLGFGSLKDPIKSKLSKMAPPHQDKRVSAGVDIDKLERRAAASSVRERGFFHRSTSKKQAAKESGSPSLLCTTKKFSSPAQVSPENQ